MPAVERLGAADLPDCLSLSEEAGWNQTADDWCFLLKHGEVFGLRADGRVVASAALSPYPPATSWVCMVLVTAAERRQAHASRLVAHCIARSAALGLASGLDATPAGHAVYRGLGFRDVFPIMRMRAERPEARAAADGTEVERAEPDGLAAVLDYDRRIFGADRGPLLQHLFTRSPALSHLAGSADRLRGFVLGRAGRAATQVGPLVANDEGIAIALAAAALRAAPAGPVIIDVPLHQPKLRAWLGTVGFVEERPFTRMLEGEGPLPGDPSRVMAITGPEFS